MARGSLLEATPREEGNFREPLAGMQKDYFSYELLQKL